MSEFALVRALGHLVLDTFRQSSASRICWVMLLVSALATGVCLSVSVSGDPTAPPLAPGEREEWLPGKEAQRYKSGALQTSGVVVVRGQLSIGFGLVQLPLDRDRRTAVRQIELFLAVAIADTIGILLTLIWTAAFLPTFLEPAAASVLLAKPVPRALLLIGKFVGTVIFVAIQGAVFVVSTWLALGLRTGIWDTLYFSCIPIFVLHFAVFFSFSTLLAVWTRSTITCVFSSVFFWLVCWGMNFGHHAALEYRLLDQTFPPDQLALLAVNPGGGLPGAIPWFAVATVRQAPEYQHNYPWLLEIGYWLLPKPADLNFFLFRALDAGHTFALMPEFHTLESRQAFYPGWSIFSSLVFTLVFLGLAIYEFTWIDY